MISSSQDSVQEFLTSVKAFGNLWLNTVLDIMRFTRKIHTKPHPRLGFHILTSEDIDDFTDIMFDLLNCTVVSV